MNYYSLIKHERELREKGEKDLARALELQAKEYERRLETLNHESKRIYEVQVNSVSRESWDITMKEWNKWREDVNRHIYRLHGAWALLSIILMLISIYFRAIFRT